MSGGNVSAQVNKDAAQASIKLGQSFILMAGVFIYSVSVGITATQTRP